MGPAQFIASTWVLFQDRITAALGLSTTPNPWNPQDAFMASSLYLSDLGAGAGRLVRRHRSDFQDRDDRIGFQRRRGNRSGHVQTFALSMSDAQGVT